jgi:hypothetical protein
MYRLILNRSLARNKELERRLRGQENGEYKSRLFGFIFGREENKE